MPEVGGVREYNRIRRFLSRIYLYGFFSREDFARAGIGSAKDYDYGMKLIRAIFPDSEEAALWRDGRKYPRVLRTYQGSGENRLTDSYLLHALDTREDLPELLRLLGALGEESRTLEELRRQAETWCRDEGADKYGVVRRRVLDLAAYGYVEKEGRRYRLAEDWLGKLSLEQAEELLCFVRFAAGTTYPRVAGSFLRRSLERELHRRGQEVAEHPPLLLRHSANANVFDEDMVCQLQDLQGAHRLGVLTLEKGTRTVLPVALRIDTRLGRWYLLALEGDRPLILRVSRILSVKAGEKVPLEEWRRGEQIVKARFAHAGCSGAMPWGAPVRVEAKLDFSSAPGLYHQFLRELRLGRVTEGEDGLRYEAQVNDPLELLPLLRSYAPWLRVLPGEHGLDVRLREDLEAMGRAAEEDSHEVL